MPISQFGSGLQKVLSFLPGTYGTSLVRSHMMGGAFDAMGESGVTDAVVTAIRDSVDCNAYFFGNAVSEGTMYLFLAGSTAVLVGLYVLILTLKSPRKK